MSTYIVASLPLPLYCGILLLAKQHETKLVSILLIDEQLRLPCCLLVLLLTISSSCIMLLIIDQLRLPCYHGAVIVTFFIRALYFIYLNGSSPNYTDV
jgi:hypothetical protein